MDFQTFFKSKWATAALGLLLLMVLAGFFQLYMQKFEVQKEIQGLQAKSEEINRENEKLSELIKYLNTEEYTQRAARDKLNLKKEGEHVVSLPASSLADSSSSDASKQQTNAQKWYNYFFR